jgi:hypothetical protein
LIRALFIDVTVMAKGADFSTPFAFFTYLISGQQPYLQLVTSYVQS